MSNHTYTKKIGGDFIDLILVFQVERKTVIISWRLRWGFRESGLLIE